MPYTLTPRRRLLAGVVVALGVLMLLEVLLRVAITSGARITRFVPVVGAGSGAVLNFLEVHRVGRRLKDTWRARHAIAGFDPRSAIEVEVLQG